MMIHYDDGHMPARDDRPMPSVAITFLKLMVFYGAGVVLMAGAISWAVAEAYKAFG